MSEARVRVSLTGGELEIEGSEDFVAQYDDVVGQLLDKFKEVPVVEVVRSALDPDRPEGGSGADLRGTGGGSDEGLPEFGEALHMLPKDASGTDQILLAGYYAQEKSTDSTFATGDANKLLIEQGIKLANPTQSLNNNQASKRVFKVGKKWKIGKPGEDHLKSFGISL